MRFQQSSSSACASAGEHARLRGVAGPVDEADENDASEQLLGEPAPASACIPACRCWRSPAASKTRCSPAAAALLRRAVGGRHVGPVWGEGVAEEEGVCGMVCAVTHGGTAGEGGLLALAEGQCNMPPGRLGWLDATNKGPRNQGTKMLENSLLVASMRDVASRCEAREIQGGMGSG